jgi:hypothetical protein
MIRHLLQIFFTLGLTFNVFSSGAGPFPAQIVLYYRGPRGSAPPSRYL